MKVFINDIKMTSSEKVKGVLFFKVLQMAKERAGKEGKRPTVHLSGLRDVFQKLESSVRGW